VEETVTGERLRQGPPRYPFTFTHNNHSTLKTFIHSNPSSISLKYVENKSILKIT